MSHLFSWCAKNTEDLEQLVNLWISLTRQKCALDFNWKRGWKWRLGENLEKWFGSNHLGHDGAQWPNVNGGGVLGTTKQDFRSSGKRGESKFTPRKKEIFAKIFRSPVPQSDHLVSVNPDRNSKGAGESKISNLDHLLAMVFDLGPHGVD